MFLSLGLAPAAWAQPLDAGWLIGVDYGPGRNALSPANPTARITVSAHFSPNTIYYAFAAARWDVAAAESGWSDNRILPPLTVGASPGTIDGGLVWGILAGQIHFPPPLPANPSNPIGAWTALWTTSDFRARTIGISTDTMRFDLYLTRGQTVPILPGPTFQEGAAEIRVVPGPGAAVLLLALIRRRRL